ncbi:NAD(P)-dependent oxidoreductase [Zestomonas thermotolerans]|uniref:NAD(P)-dependent oxidoreductase n=1 Tax=Zestomonas thermotolerans TaxID=157784 RepID=UPI0023EFAD58|nr:NAD(P)-dependent oxidoreductase [Pseudomonas thermotolerans]
MKIALIGATGFVGSALLQEALNRGHSVTAIVRHPEKLPAHQRLVPQATSVYDAEALAHVLAGHDVVVSAFNPGWNDPEIRQHFIAGSQAILAATRTAGVRRLLAVGGAGSLYVAPGVQLIDTPEFPAAYREGAEGARQLLNMLRDEQALDWTFVSPPALLEPGKRSGRYRLGGDQLLMDGESPARISVADLAVAIIDELERPQHPRRRFTVGY